MVDQLPEEFLMEMLEAFQLFVANKNEKTVKTEKLGALLHVLGYSLSDREERDVASEVDPAGVGSFDFPQFAGLRLWLVSMNYDRCSELDPMKVLCAFDPDKTGVISLSDLRSALATFDLSSAEIESVIHDTGFDGQTTIDYVEFYRKAMSI